MKVAAQAGCKIMFEHNPDEGHHTGWKCRTNEE